MKTTIDNRQMQVRRLTATLGVAFVVLALVTALYLSVPQTATTAGPAVALADRSYDAVEHVRSSRAWPAIADHSYDEIEAIRAKWTDSQTADHSYDAIERIRAARSGR